MANHQTDYATIQALFDDGRLDDAALGELLNDQWAAAYRAHACPGDDPEPVEVDQADLTYLFDLTLARVVGVYGRSSPTNAPRPAARMRGFPLPPEPAGVVRGHLVAHSLGGGADINLIPQAPD